MNKLFCISAFFLMALSLAARSEYEEKLMKAIGAQDGPNDTLLIDKAVLDKKTKILSFPADLNIREGSIEVLISTKSGRIHESLLITEMDPFKLQLALILAGYRNGPLMDGMPLPKGAVFDIIVVTKDGKEHNVCGWLQDSLTVKTMPDRGWVFIGSNFQDNRCIASIEGNMVNINSNDTSTILNASVSGEEAAHEFTAVTALLPGAEKYALAVKNNQPVPECPVTVKLVPRKADAAAKKAEIPPEHRPPAPAVIEAEIAKIKLKGDSPVSDYAILENALYQRIPAEHPQAALRIIDLKLKLIDEYLKIHEKEKFNPYYIKVQSIRQAVERAKLLFR